MIQCPECRSMIPDDSAFCDQCGKELKWCPECKRPKRGTECPFCGSDLIPGRMYLAGGAAAQKPTADQPPIKSTPAPETPAGPAPKSAPEAPSGPAPQSTMSETPAGPTRLVGNGWSLLLQPGGFGRRGGIWPELATCPYVSGNHGEISRGSDGWVLVDIGSTNGTFVNGQRMVTGQGVSLRKGDRVRIATLDFTVE